MDPYLLLQSLWETSGSLACWSISAAGPPPEIRPQPSVENVLADYWVISYKLSVNITDKIVAIPIYVEGKEVPKICHLLWRDGHDRYSVYTQPTIVL